MITRENIQDLFNRIDKKTLKRFQKSTKEFFFISINSYGYIIETIATDDNSGKYKSRVSKNPGNEVLLENNEDTQYLIDSALENYIGK